MIFVKLVSLSFGVLEMFGINSYEDMMKQVNMSKSELLWESTHVTVAEEFIN